MSRRFLLDEKLARHECVVCDLCGEGPWTLDVALRRGWKQDRRGNDLCEKCKPQKKEKRKAVAQ